MPNSHSSDAPDRRRRPGRTSHCEAAAPASSAYGVFVGFVERKPGLRRRVTLLALSRLWQKRIPFCLATRLPPRRPVALRPRLATSLPLSEKYSIPRAVVRVCTPKHTCLRSLTGRRRPSKASVAFRGWGRDDHGRVVCRPGLSCVDQCGLMLGVSVGLPRKNLTRRLWIRRV